MGSLAVPSLNRADTTTRPPELSDQEYVRAVLKQPPGRTEDDIEKELLEEAQTLGIDTSAPATTRPCTPLQDPTITGTDSAVAIPSPRHVRTGSSASNGSDTDRAVQYSSTFPSAMTETSPSNMITRKRSKSLSFSQYEKYLSQVDPNLSQPKFLPQTSTRPRAETTTGIFGESTRRSVKGIRKGISEKLKWRRRSIHHANPPMSCICCREDFTGPEHRTALQTLPCGHTYCQDCLTVMINQSTTEESKMPPRCCTQPIPGSIIKSIFDRDEQQAFLKAVLQYSTPWESRIFCPNTCCGEFIPPLSKVDPKHPFEAECRTCKTRVCVTCKRPAHRIGQDCPDDWELDAVLKMGEKSGWRRCYKCRTLVELTQGCTHMTCRCKAQFCYICGAVWDPIVGCPNYCNGEEELERRRMEEEAREAELEAEKQAQEEAAALEEVDRIEAEKRTRESVFFQNLAERQRLQMEEFRKFEQKMKWIMWTRHSQKRLTIIEKYKDQLEKMKDRHAKTEQHLEDRQIEAEIELRYTLEQSEKSVRIQLKYMEAYCNGLGRFTDHDLPEREVTQKHLEQLGQQYHIRDGMERRHQSQINVLREKQAKRMEELMERHQAELSTLTNRRTEEVEDLGVEFANEEEALVRVFDQRKARMRRRWVLEIEVLRRTREMVEGVGYGNLPLPEWPSDGESEDSLPSVREEDAHSERTERAG